MNAQGQELPEPASPAASKEDVFQMQIQKGKYKYKYKYKYKD